MRYLFRFIGLLFLAGAFAALIVDATRFLGAGTVTFLPLGRMLAAVSPGGLQKARLAVDAKLPFLWDPVMVTILLLPIWLVLGVVGLVLLLVTRRPAPTIGFSRR